MQVPTYEEIKPYIADGWIEECSHPENEDVKIFNYTHETQWQRKWDDITRQCRGLIMNVVTGEVLARPIPKFFNYEEWVSMGESIPTEPPIVLEKVDGMLGIIYWLNGKPWVATRGRFMSDHAQWATALIRTPEYADRIKNSNKGWTYVFEIIRNESRIVLRYDFEDLVWLGEVNIKTGKFQPSFYSNLGFRVPELHEFTDVQTLTSANLDGKEGYVLYYKSSGLLLKIKFDEYKRLHKIITGLSVLGIWEYMVANGVNSSAHDVVKDVPDEFFSWVEEIHKQLVTAYRSIHAETEAVFLQVKGMERAEAAKIIKTSKYPAVVFSMLDGKKTEELIWKMVRPTANKVLNTSEA